MISKMQRVFLFFKQTQINWGLPTATAKDKGSLLIQQKRSCQHVPVHFSPARGQVESVEKWAVNPLRLIYLLCFVFPPTFLFSLKNSILFIDHVIISTVEMMIHKTTIITMTRPWRGSGSRGYGWDWEEIGTMGRRSRGHCLHIGQGNQAHNVLAVGMLCTMAGLLLTGSSQDPYNSFAVKKQNLHIMHKSNNQGELISWHTSYTKIIVLLDMQRAYNTETYKQ
jgi:hypothetical protein